MYFDVDVLKKGIVVATIICFFVSVDIETTYNDIQADVVDSVITDKGCTTILEYADIATKINGTDVYVKCKDKASISATLKTVKVKSIYPINFILGSMFEIDNQDKNIENERNTIVYKQIVLEDE